MASTFPKITIITPTYNQGEFIEKTIISVLDQNYPNLEYIIIDGGSTDATIDIIKKYEKQITYWISEPDYGQSDAINKGFKLASGDIINWLNSDDYLEENTLSMIANEFKIHSIDVLCGYSNLITPKGVIKKRTSRPETNYAEFIAHGHIMQPSTFFSKEIFNEFTPLENSLHYMMDHYLWLQYICKYGTAKVKYIDSTIAHVLIHENAKSYKMINLFKEDKERIYFSLFKSMNLKWLYPNTKTLKPLHFENYSGQVKENSIEINFLLIADILFERDSFGNRGKITYIHLFFMISHFPKRSIMYVFNKFIK